MLFPKVKGSLVLSGAQEAEFLCSFSERPFRCNIRRKEMAHTESAWGKRTG